MSMFKGKEEYLKHLIVMCQEKKFSLQATVETLLAKEPDYFKEKSQAFDFVLSSLSEHLSGGEFEEYKKFFDQHLANAKKDFISGHLVEMRNGAWTPVLLRLDSIKSYGVEYNLKPNKIQMHLDRYILTKKPELLFEYPAWDGKDRFHQLKDYIKIKNQDFEVFEDAMKEWGANIFRRIACDEYQNRCIILKGGQGMGKDTLIKSMFKGFSPYYAKFSSNRDEREAWSQVTSALVLHIEEFDQTGQMSVSFLKDLITRDWVTYRSPYDRTAATRKCYGSFISTVNIDSVLRDETGNRRFAVFDIESIKWFYPKDWSPQIVAQCFELYKADHFAKEETWAKVALGNGQFEQVNLTYELLDLWDKRVAQLSISKGLVELTFSDIEPIVMDMAKISGMRAKGICSMLKVSERSRHGRSGTVYWSKMQKMQLVKDGGLSSDSSLIDKKDSIDHKKN